MEEILKEIMNNRCGSLLYDASTCSKKGGCDGHCPYFQEALYKLNAAAYIDMCNIKSQLK